MNFWINIILFVASLWVLLRLLRFLLAKSKFRKYIPYLDRSRHLIWLILGNWMLFSLLPTEPRVVWLLPFSLGLLAIYVFQEWLAGWLFKGFYQLSEGQTIKIGRHQGQVIEIDSRQIVLKQQSGIVTLPFASVVWKPVWQKRNQVNSNRFRFQFSVDDANTAEELKNNLQQRVWLHPSILAKPAPVVQITEEAGKKKAEVTLSLIPGQSAQGIEKYLAEAQKKLPQN